ncbi:hypothetical protein [Serratia microhaemolytica]|uniref:hypothetical protein n=1 Tax=Serratia microhaemolytica TaxID=2675110 RepID=UPI000FDEC5C3|nr:hypothetical protein [Serratia microhaemolytica]
MKLNKVTNGLLQPERAHTLSASFGTTCTRFVLQAAATLLLSCTLSSVHAASAGPAGTYPVGNKASWSTQVSGAVRSTTHLPVASDNSRYPWGAYLSDTPPRVGFNNMNTCLPASKFATMSDGSVSGYRIANDILLVTTFGNLFGRYWWHNGTSYIYQSVRGDFQGNGRMNFTEPNAAASYWCLAARTVDRNATLTQTGGSSADIANAFIVLYIGPKAVPGTYNSPSIYLGRVFNENYLTLVNNSSFRVVPATDCSIALQDANVDFGPVNNTRTDRAVLGSFTSGLDIQCATIYNSSGGNTIAMTLKFAGTVGRANYALSLRDTGNVELAEVHGVRSNTTVSCNSAVTNKITFSGTNVSIGNIGAGLTSIPLTWTLCSNGALNYGNGTARATVTLSWP